MYEISEVFAAPTSRETGCPYFTYLIYNENPIMKLTYEYVNNFLEKENWKLKSKEYINSFTKLECICPKKHIVFISFNNYSIDFKAVWNFTDFKILFSFNLFCYYIF